jgi:hypothetical protein
MTPWQFGKPEPVVPGGHGAPVQKGHTGGNGGTGG